MILNLHILSLLAIEGVRFESITNKDGLSHNTVRSIMQDSRGFMWIGTINGLNRYDGHKFILMEPEFGIRSLSENNLRYTVEDEHGNIWIQTTSRMVDCYHTHTESFIGYTNQEEAGNYKYIEIMPQKDIWMWGKENGACHIRYVNDNLESILYDINNIGTNEVAFVLEDLQGIVWMGTDKGLWKMTNQSPLFYQIDGKIYNYHSAIEQHSHIYFFTTNDLILVFDKEKQVFLPSVSLSDWKDTGITHTFALDEELILITGKKSTLALHTATGRVTDSRFLFSGEVPKHSHIIVDNQKNCWIYNKSGNIWRYLKEKKRFERYQLIPSDILSIIDLERYSIYEDSRGIIWITTFGNGLFVIEEDGKVTHFTAENSGLRTNYLLTITEDRMGDIWIGTEYTGIVKVSLTKYNNRVLLANSTKADGLGKTIRSIYENKKNGNLWIGTKGGDVYFYDKELKEKGKLLLHKGLPYCMTADTHGNTWIGTKGNGILVVPQEKEIPVYQDLYSFQFPDDNDSGANNIYSILCDSRGRMWVGTFGSGLYLCELRNKKIDATPVPGISSKQKQIRCMIEDQEGFIWAGGENGIIVFHPDSLLTDNDRFKQLCFDKNNPYSLNNNIVKALFEDSRNQVWAGTSGGGLNLAKPNDSTGKIDFQHYTSEEGVINNVIQAILEDNNQNLWISTENGISKFDLNNLFFENYNFPDTWESDLFCESSALKRSDGKLLFGSHNGMYIFNPSSFESRQVKQSVTLTGLSINGIPILPDAPDSPLTQSITETRSIQLKSNQNSFSIEFSSLNFQSSHSNRYTYILENYDKRWNPVTQYNVATYKNLPAGKYVFKVKNHHNQHEQSQTETQLVITVVPPFWKSSNAFFLYAILLIIIILTSIKLIIKMNKLHNEVEVEKQLTEFRLRFFTNISHEFRTPLTIIKGSIESMNSMSALPTALKKNIRTLDKSSDKLMRLIDQLLEFRKMQNNKMDLRLEQTEMVSFIKGIYEIFSETAERRGIHFTFSSNEALRTMLADRGKIEKIVFNLLSNAFKHTPEKGEITVELLFDEPQQLFTLKVSDSGMGIAPNQRNQLFVRFKQINYSSSGIGIGLNLTSELTTTHKGSITYSDSEWGGACFTVIIPMNADIYDESDLIKENTPEKVMLVKETATEESYENIVPDAHLSTQEYKILLIEDDEEIRLFLEEQLKAFFTVLTASNGLMGWETATREQPNLIVCDVMMPEMNGFEVTRKLKSDIESCHIPIILLTAHSSTEHQLEGIQAGADSYIIKPFSTQYLISRIIKLIEQREKLQHKFAHEPGMIQTTICTSNRDKEFINKLHTIIEKNMDNPNFSMDDFAQAAHMGRTIFYKKIKGITNFSPNEYLRIVRLKHAAEILRSTDLNVSEIAYKVGFNDPDYFSKCFKDQFGMRPTKFRNSAENEEKDRNLI